MKQLLIIISIILIHSSCSKELTETPKNFLSPVNFYKNESDAQAAINGAYSAYYPDQVQYMMLEIQSDYATGGGSFTSINNTDQVLDAVGVGRTADSWRTLYNLINRANVVLNRVPDIENINENNQKRILAEAHFLRATGYFNLVRNWGAVPLRISETVDLSTIATPRASVDSVYKLIIDDLTISENDLPESVGNETGKASKWAAKMLLADVYLTIGEWAKSAEKASDVINSNQYSLVTVNKESDFYKIFATETSTEDIMSLHFSPTRSSDFINYLHQPNTPFYNEGTGWFILFPNMQSPLIKNWDDLDLRKSFNIYSKYADANGDTVPLPSTTPFLFKKYIKDHNGFNDFSMPMFRYSEAFLIYAEASCMAEGSPSPLALDRLNTIKRRGYGYDPFSPSPIDYPNGLGKEEFRDTVLLERAHELMLERRRWYDLKRTGVVAEAIAAAKGKTLIDARLLFPIPQEEINNNPALSQSDQNPGY